MYIYILYIHMSSTSYDVVSNVTSHPSNIYVYTCIVSCCLWIFSTIGLQQWKRWYMYNGQKLVMFIPKSFKLIILVIWIVVWPSCRCITLTMARLKLYIQIHYIQDGLGCNVPMSLKVGKCRSSKRISPVLETTTHSLTIELTYCETAKLQTETSFLMKVSTRTGFVWK